MVSTLILGLNDDFSSGPDGIPPIIIKRCSDSLSSPIAHLFNLSLQCGIFPDFWKKSYITPVHKKGARSDVSNYRPIAKISCLPKLFEQIIYSHLYEFCKPLICKEQHGFQRGKSTVTNLVSFVSRVINAMEKGDQVDTIFTDISKAFDTIPHDIILSKHKMAGFSDHSLGWLGSYLVGRDYQVLFRSAISEGYSATSGVPQGSHLGPLCFIVATNDAPLVIKNSFLDCFADDSKLSRIISSTSDCRLLQDDLDNFALWCRSNGLELNTVKCQVVSFSRKHSSTLSAFNYYLNGALLNRTDTICDLGVILDSNLDFRNHYERIINKANGMLGFIKRWSREFRCPYLSKILYTTYVRPILEYASQVWSPFRIIHINRVESVQKRFLRFALYHLPWSDPLRLPSYESRLKFLHIEPLKKRRAVADMVFVHQIICGNIIAADISKHILFRTTSHDCRSVELFVIAFHRTDYGKFEPITRMLRLINLNVSSFDVLVSKFVLKRRLADSAINFYPF